MIKLNRACILVIDGKSYKMGDLFEDYPQDVDPSYFAPVDPEVQDGDENPEPQPDHGSASESQE